MGKNGIMVRKCFDREARDEFSTIINLQYWTSLFSSPLDDSHQSDRYSHCDLYFISFYQSSAGIMILVRNVVFGLEVRFRPIWLVWRPFPGWLIKIITYGFGWQWLFFWNSDWFWNGGSKLLISFYNAPISAEEQMVLANCQIKSVHESRKIVVVQWEPKLSWDSDVSSGVIIIVSIHDGAFIVREGYNNFSLPTPDWKYERISKEFGTRLRQRLVCPEVSDALTFVVFWGNRWNLDHL